MKLAADAARSGGVSVKSLTLAPHVVEKKATHAVTCNTLKCESPTPYHAPGANLLICTCNHARPGRTPQS